MRHVSLGLALILVVTTVGVTPAQETQEPAPWLAVQNCSIKPTEGAALRVALQEFIDYIVAKPVDLPGNVYGGVPAACERHSELYPRRRGREYCTVECLAERPV